MTWLVNDVLWPFIVWKQIIFLKITTGLSHLRQQLNNLFIETKLTNEIKNTVCSKFNLYYDQQYMSEMNVKENLSLYREKIGIEFETNITLKWLKNQE